MDNYFVSKNRGKSKFIIPEVGMVTDKFNPSAKKLNDSVEPMDAFRATKKFNPYTIRVSHPMALEAFVFGPDNVYYEVIEGLYMLEDGTIKLKVRTKYGKQLSK